MFSGTWIIIVLLGGLLVHYNHGTRLWIYQTDERGISLAVLCSAFLCKCI